MAVRPEYFPGFEKRLTNVVWTATGGVVFLRFKQTWTGESPGPEPGGLLSFPEIGWASFNPFTGVSADDPEETGTTAPIQDPITPQMLTRYRWWRHDAPINTSGTKPGVPGEPKWVVDYAGWYGTWHNNDTGQAASGGREETRLILYNGWVEFWAAIGGTETVEFHDYGVRLSDHLVSAPFPHFEITPEPPAPVFFQVASANGWLYHEEPGEVGPTRYTRATYATIIINLAKILKKLPKEPKPINYSFRIDLPTAPPSTPGHPSAFNWVVEGAAYRTTVSNPPKPTDGRRTFPVGDQALGSPGPEDDEHLVPQWESWSTDAATDGTLDPPAGSFIFATITFGTKDAPPKIEFSGTPGGGPVEG
jgi:hypothetical protein